MKVITKYECEICGTQYKTKDRALQCEAKGDPNLNLLPKGLMFEYNHHGYCGIYAVGYVTKWNEGKSHLLHYNSWACRAPHLPGDTLGQTCGGDFYPGLEKWKAWKFISKEHVDGPEFKRMVTYIKSVGLIPRYYNENGTMIELK